MSDFANMKVRSHVHRWMKAEAARRGIALYQLMEDLIEDAFGPAPWELPSTPGFRPVTVAQPAWPAMADEDQ